MNAFRQSTLTILGATALTMTLGASTRAWAQIGVAGTFDRSFTVSGTPDLDVRTNSGSVTIRRGGGSTVQIHGEIRIGTGRWFRSTPSDADIRGLEQKPPITQSGNSIRIDRLPDEDRWNSVSISYEIVAPDTTRVRAATGSAACASATWPPSLPRPGRAAFASPT